MKIILLEKVEKLGSLGDQVEVKNGYARNYLLPTGKALRATEENIKYFEEILIEINFFVFKVSTQKYFFS